MSATTSSGPHGDPLGAVLPITAAAPSADGTPLDAAAREQALAVLGMLAYSELAAFSRLAADAAQAPSLGQRLELSRLAGVALARVERIGDRVVALGAELQPVMAPFAGLLVEFDARTPAGTWWERLLKGYVGYGVADDFCRLVAQGLDPVTRDLVLEVLTDAGHAQLVVDSLADGALGDATLASRLALWGRRLVGESLGVVQRVVADHPPLGRLLERAMADAAGTGDPQARLFPVLTAEHSRRMERLGLTP